MEQRNKRRIGHYTSLMYHRAVADLTSETRRGYLGMLWWVLEPALYLSVFYLIFVVIFDRGGEDRASFILIGLVVWKFFGASVPLCANSMTANARLIRQIYIPKIIFPSIRLITTFFKYIIVLTLLLIFLLLAGKKISVVWLSLPVLIMVQFLLILSIGSLLAAIVPFLPDLKLVITNGMTLLFFLSGVFFDISRAPLEMQAYLKLNPMMTIINCFREVLLEDGWPPWSDLGIIVCASLGVLLVGWLLLNRFDRLYPKVI